MKGELFINGKDAWNEWGVTMGNNFFDAIDAPAPKKEYIKNDSRMEDGVRYADFVPKTASRQFSLHFTIKGVSEADYRKKKNAFIAELEMGTVEMTIPCLDANVVYRLKYLGSGISYGLSRDRKFGTFASKFEEPNPKDRAIST